MRRICFPGRAAPESAGLPIGRDVQIGVRIDGLEAWAIAIGTARPDAAGAVGKIENSVRSVEELDSFAAIVEVAGVDAGDREARTVAFFECGAVRDDENVL